MGASIFVLQVLPDDPRDDAHGHATLHIQAGDSKGHIILLSGHPVVVAEVGYQGHWPAHRELEAADDSVGQWQCQAAALYRKLPGPFSASVCQADDMKDFMNPIIRKL